jgi:hypothetical protein
MAAQTDSLRLRTRTLADSRRRGLAGEPWVHPRWNIVAILIIPLIISIHG